MRAVILSLLVCFSLVMSAFVAARADTPSKRVGAYGDWTVYTFFEGNNKVCYMQSEPKKSEGKYKLRSKPYVYLTTRPSEGTKNVFSFIAGYDYKGGSEIDLSIDKTKFTLFTQKDTAWAKDDAADNNIAQTIRKGGSMIVKGASLRGTQTVDTFSLNGAGDAQDAVAKECGS